MKILGAALALSVLAGCSSTQPNATQAPRTSSTTTTTSARPKAPVTPVTHTYKPAPPVSYKPSVPERTVRADDRKQVLATVFDFVVGTFR